MANKKISQLTVAAPLTGTEVLPIVQGGVTVQATAQNIADLAGGLEGTQYVFVAANGTDVENAAELQAAYDLAKTKVQIIQIPGSNLIDDVFSGNPQSIQTGQNNWSWNFPNYLPEPIPLGVQNVEVVSDDFSGIIEIDVTNSGNTNLEFTYNGSPLTNVTVFALLIETVQRATVIASPMYYNFNSDFVMDEEYIDLVSLDGNRSIIFNGTGTLLITANDVFVKGVDVLNKNFTIADDLSLLKVENCKGGDFSFGGIDTSGNNQITVSGTFTDCVGGNSSFGGNGVISGKFNNCTGGNGSFGGNGVMSGEFTDCIGGSGSFGGGSTVSISSGVFTNCIIKGGGFGHVSSGTFTNCTGGNDSFAFRGEASGVFTNCEGGANSFAGSSQGGILSGKLYYCRLTSGAFPTVSGSGITRLCIDGANNENNQG